MQDASEEQVEVSSSNERSVPLKELEGETFEEAVAKLGQPQQDVMFDLSEGVTEFRIELLNTFGEEFKQGKSVMIREVTWVDNDHFITLWFHQAEATWSAVSVSRWHKDTEF